MLVSCIMPTANRRQFLPSSIAMFLSQCYPKKELIIINESDEPVDDLIPDGAPIRCVTNKERLTTGGKRNLACKIARGEIILHWDDDDWYTSWRTRYQVESLLEADADVCGLRSALFFDESISKAWEYVYGNTTSPWLCGATLCYRKSLWERHPFANVRIGEDTRFVFNLGGARTEALPNNGFFVGRIHAGNTSKKLPWGSRWAPRSVEVVHSIIRNAEASIRP